ncbi:MAG: sensor histidine kinase [Phycisphaerales bacterium]
MRPDQHVGDAPRPSLDQSLAHMQRLATLGTLTGMIAHEFNNILTPVMSYAQMALDAPADQALARKALQRAAAGAEKAARIAEAILELSRDGEPGQGKSGGADLADIGAAVKSATACLVREPRKEGIAVSLDVASAGCAAIRPIALQQVVLNLMLNARKAMAGSGGALSITARVSAGEIVVAHGAVRSGNDQMPNGQTAKCKPPGWVELVVKDTGCGIAADVLPRVFEAFVTREGTQARGRHEEGTKHVPHRLRKAEVRHGGSSIGGTGEGADALVAKGTGLGLAMCAQLVHDAGGFLWVRSVVGEGTEVGVVLPAAAAVAKAPARNRDTLKGIQRKAA